MKEILSRVRWFFTGLGLFLPLVPRFVWIATENMYRSTVDYWKNSQSIVDKISYDYMKKVPARLTSEYDKFVGWICYGLAAFLYLLGWLAMSWLTVEAFRRLVSAMF